jgi:hypothetical protein
MSPSAIVLNVSAAIFLALFLILASFLLVRFRKMRQLHLSAKEAKEVPLFSPEVVPMVKRQLKYKLVEAE